MTSLDGSPLLVQILKDPCPTEQSIRQEPVALALVKQRGEDTDKARHWAAKCRKVCDTNEEFIRFAASMQAEETSQLKKLAPQLRTEFSETRECCDIYALASQLRAKRDAVVFIDDTHSYWIEYKAPFDRITWLDALENVAHAEHAELVAAAVYSRIRTLARLGPLIEAEGEVGVVGAATAKLWADAEQARTRIEYAERAAREARQAFDKQQVALASRGMVTRANVGHTI